MASASPSVLAQLRGLMPNRPLNLVDARWVAERQANRMLALQGVTEPPVPEAVITDLPRLWVRRADLNKSSGGCQWIANRWLILLKASDLPTRQRFSLAHEYKHILDHPFGEHLYPPMAGLTTSERAERACEFFAACLLMPRLWVRRAFTAGAQDLRLLAETFDVSRSAMRIRLDHLGLTPPTPRCAPARRGVDRSAIDYYRRVTAGAA